MLKLTARQIQTRLTKINNWHINGAGEIEKTCTFTGFPQSLLFVMAVGVLAEAAQHHPNITIQWNKVTLALTTHDANGLSDKDFALAKQIDALPML